MKSKWIVIGLIIFMTWSLGCFLFGRYYYPKQEIKVTEEVKQKTIWKEPIPTTFSQDTFNRLLVCATADIDFKYKTEQSYLYVTAFDSCKENTARYEIGTKGNWRVYVGVAFASFVIGGLAYHYLR